MKLIGTIRLGRDVEVKFTGKGTAVANIAGVYEYGMKGDDGKKPAQWVDLALFGKQAEAMAQYLKKGTVVDVTANDVHVDTYQGKNGPASKLVGRVIDIGFTPSQPQKDAAPVRQQAAKPADDIDDDIPF